MSWVRVNNTLPGSPKVIALARLLGCSMAEALGLAVRWFCWLNTHTADGKSGLPPGDVDAHIFGVKGACVAFGAIGWAKLDEAGHVCAVDYEVYNGAQAKRRAQGAARVRRLRAKNKVSTGKE